MDNFGKGIFSGSTFDDFLQEESLYKEVEAAAIQRVLAWQIEHAASSDSSDDDCIPSQD